MKNKIQKMYIQDFSIILVSTFMLWMLLLFVMSRVVNITPNNTARLIISLAAITACAFVTASSIAVLSHLKKNKNQLYEEEINNSKLL